MGNFQYFLLAICPYPGIIAPSQITFIGSGLNFVLVRVSTFAVSRLNAVISFTGDFFLSSCKIESVEIREEVLISSANPEKRTKKVTNNMINLFFKTIFCRLTALYASNHRRYQKGW